MRKKLISVSTLFVLFLILLSVTSLTYFFKPEIAHAKQEVQVSFFFGDGCPHCAKVEPIISNLRDKFPQVIFNDYEIYHNKNNALLLYQLYEQYNVPKEDQGGVPIVFINKEYFMGDKPIIDNLENKIITALALVKSEEKINTINIPDSSIKKVEEEILPTIPVVENNNIIEKETDNQTEKSYSLWAIFGAALVDSINPCAIAVLLILLTALMIGAKSKKRALLGGLAFTFSIYITYFLFGLGLLQFIAVTNLSNIIAKIVGVVALIIGLANIKDYFFYGGGGFVMEIPRKWRPALKRILSSITSPLGAFFAGFIITLFELPCTGGPYFFVIGLLSQAEHIKSIIPTLLFYNLVFVLPLILIVFIVYFGVSSVEKTEQWKEKNIKKLHLITGIMMLALGIWVLI